MASTIGVGLLLLTGCAAMRGGPAVTDPETAAEIQNRQLCNDCRAKAAPADRTYCRNLLIQQRRRIIDDDFFAFEKSMRSENTALNLGSDLAVLGLSGAGALAPGAAAVLAAISGGLTGARAAADKDTYYDKTIPAIFAAMEAQRQLVLVKIETGLAKPADEYDTCAAFSDLLDYRRAGSIDGALMQITAQSGDTISKADKQIEEIRRGVYVEDDADMALERFWMPDGETVDQQNEAALRKWMKQHDAGRSIWFFLHSDTLKDARAAAARDLKIPGFGG